MSRPISRRLRSPTIVEVRHDAVSASWRVPARHARRDDVVRLSSQKREVSFFFFVPPSWQGRESKRDVVEHLFYCGFFFWRSNKPRFCLHSLFFFVLMRSSQCLNFEELDLTRFGDSVFGSSLRFGFSLCNFASNTVFKLQSSNLKSVLCGVFHQPSNFASQRLRHIGAGPSDFRLRTSAFRLPPRLSS